MKTKHYYHIESLVSGQWLKILQGSPLQYCQGFLDARKDYAPRNAYRLIRSDGCVLEELPAREDVNIGQIAGWPTAEQYEAAAKRALERANAIREVRGAKADQSGSLDAVVSRHIRERLPRELALGFARYEALRRLNLRQHAELHKRNLAGENFDRMVDAIVVDVEIRHDADSTAPKPKATPNEL